MVVANLIHVPWITRHPFKRRFKGFHVFRELFYLYAAAIWEILITMHKILEGIVLQLYASKMLLQPATAFFQQRVLWRNLPLYRLRQFVAGLVITQRIMYKTSTLLCQSRHTEIKCQLIQYGIVVSVAEARV